MRLPFRSAGGRPQRTAGLLLLFLFLGVLTPIVCVLWFMNEAARTQTESARRRVDEAYRGQLWLVRDRMDSYWSGRTAAFEAKTRGAAPAAFFRIVSAGLADSVVLLNGSGALIYPPPAPAATVDPAANRPDWLAAEALERKRGGLQEAAAAYERLSNSAVDPSLAARAAQAQIRCLVRAGDQPAAIRAIQGYFMSGRIAQGTGLDGRLIAADEQLLALQSMPPGDPRFSPLAAHLAALLNDYNSTALPRDQRLFLMSELRAFPGSPALAFPTLEAERLASSFVESESARPVAGRPALEATRVPGVWKLTAANGRALALYRTATVLSSLGTLPGSGNSPESVRFSMIPPGSPATAESIPAGPLLPGWKISLTVDNRDSLTPRPVVSYLWVGSLVIAAMAVTGVMVAQSYGRQMRVARLKTDMVAAVSHELKTPLASMRLLVDSLLDEEHPDPRKTRDYLELISRENTRLSRLIENFLAFSRLERNRQKFDFRGTEASEVVRAVLEAAGERFHAASCRLDVDVSPGLPPLRADEDALVTVLLNLLDNAYKYTGAEKRIALRVFSRDGRVVFAVEDNGIGIPAREQKRIFRGFYQVDRRLARDVGGCGLGLSIVEFIVRAHGGSIEVKSRLGEGSTFSVVLPASPALGSAAA